MTESVRILVVGGGIAAASMIAQLRADGFTGNIAVVDQDPDAPYDRPPLSKEFLTSTGRAPGAPWWNDDCDLIRGSAVGLDATRSCVTLRKSDGGTQRIQAEHVVIATGAAPLRIPGIHRDVLHLRTAADARALRGQVRPGTRIAILGAGAIGTELASSATDAGARVTLIDPAAQPLQRFLGGHLGDEAAAWIRDGGVNLLLNTTAQSAERTRAGGWVVATSKGDIEADLAVSAIGTRPCVSWLRGSELDISNGIRCDRDGTALGPDSTPVPPIHAIGDVAAWAGEDGIPCRHEDWTAAQRQGRHLARALLGLNASQPQGRERDYFWTHQFGRRIQILGTPAAYGRLVTRMTNPGGRASFHTIEHDGRIVAWISVNAPRELALAMRDSMRAAF